MDFTIVNDGDEDMAVKFTVKGKVYEVTDDPEEGDTVVIRAGDDHSFSEVDVVLSIEAEDISDSDSDDEDDEDEDDTDDGVSDDEADDEDGL